mmetsp:Transcript_6386/g.26844  ORF Transcript_6386/g.26844 Transcript_6386/m.26844 type:complete len:218 (-) Transcript_6386:173-826(-)
MRLLVRRLCPLEGTSRGRKLRRTVCSVACTVSSIARAQCVFWGVGDHRPLESFEATHPGRGADERRRCSSSSSQQQQQHPGVGIAARSPHCTDDEAGSRRTGLEDDIRAPSSRPSACPRASLDAAQPRGGVGVAARRDTRGCRPVAGTQEAPRAEGLVRASSNGHVSCHVWGGPRRRAPRAACGRGGGCWSADIPHAFSTWPGSFFFRAASHRVVSV